MVNLAFSCTKGYPGQVKRHSLLFQLEDALKYLVVPLSFAHDCPCFIWNLFLARATINEQRSAVVPATRRRLLYVLHAGPCMIGRALQLYRVISPKMRHASYAISAGPAPQGGQRGQPPPQLPAGPLFTEFVGTHIWRQKVMFTLCTRSLSEGPGQSEGPGWSEGPGRLESRGRSEGRALVGQRALSVGGS